MNKDEKIEKLARWLLSNSDYLLDVAREEAESMIDADEVSDDHETFKEE